MLTDAAGQLKGHFDDNGILLLPGEDHTLVFDTMGEHVTNDNIAPLFQNGEKHVSNPECNG